MQWKSRTLVFAGLFAAAATLAVVAFPRLNARMPGSTPSFAAEPGSPPSATERVAYWVDRLVSGPEPTPYLIPDFHQSMLLDAIRNLEATPVETLNRLADPALIKRVTEQQDANPWFGILAVLASIGARRPDLTRAWAVPALSVDIVTLRRAALPALAALSSPEDGPTFLSLLARDTDDRVVAPACVKALLALGRPWDGEAVRLLFESGVADRPDGESAAWLEVPSALAEVRGGARPDVLAWWALLTESSAPRTRDAAHAAARQDSRSAGTTAPVAAACSSGKSTAASARAALARLGIPAYVASATADAAGKDPELAAIATDALARRESGELRTKLRATAAAWLDALKGAPPGIDPLPLAAEADRFVAALGADEDPAAARLLERFMRELPAGALWTPTLMTAYDALTRRGSPPEAVVRQWLETGSPDSVDRALLAVRHSKDKGYVPLLEAWVDGPGAPRKAEVRRLILLLVTFSMSHGGIEGPLAPWARKVAEWARDTTDPSAAGFLGSLLDLGAAGDAMIAEGLKGPDRLAYLTLLLRPVGRYVRPEVVEALLASVGAETSREERRAILGAAFAVAGGDAVTPILLLLRRLNLEDRPDAEMVLKIVRHRIPSGS